MSCLGPCLRHCSCSHAVLVLAYLSLAYAMASVGYMVLTRYAPAYRGTPFADTLTPEQRAILAASKRVRGQAFAVAGAAAVALLAVWRPLEATK